MEIVLGYFRCKVQTADCCLRFNPTSSTDPTLISSRLDYFVNLVVQRTHHYRTSPQVVQGVERPRRLCKCLSAIIATDHTTPQLNYHNRRNHHYYPTSVTFFTISNFKTIRFTKLKSDFVWAPPPNSLLPIVLRASVARSPFVRFP